MSTRDLMHDLGYPEVVRLLLVGGDDDELLAIANAVRRSDLFKFDIEVARDFDGALLALRGEPFDVAFVALDISGSLGGLDLMAQVQDEQLPTPFVFVSDIVDRDIDLKVVHSGGVEVISTREISVGIVERAVCHALARPRFNARSLRWDGITGVLSRNTLLEYLEDRLLDVDSLNQLSVLFVYIDNLKSINDEYGYNSGDEVLRAVAARVGSELSAEDRVGRVSGDGFLAVCQMNHRRAEELRRHILLKINQPVHLLDTVINISCSIDVAQFPFNGLSSQELVRYGDELRTSSGETTSFPIHVGFILDEEQDALLCDFERALEKNELRLEFQPQFDVIDGDVRSLEALVRWTHPERGRLMPMSFVPKLELSGRSRQLDQWVLESVVKQIKQWRSRGVPVPRVSVNVCPRSLQNDFPQWLADMCDEHGQSTSDLELELTERGEVDAQVCRVLGDVVESGARVAIDDFGAGYAGLSTLAHTPASTLKIDNAFVAKMLSSTRHRVIVSNMIELARALTMDVVAEGVETRAQYRFLTEVGAQACQGYLLLGPQAPDSMEPILMAALPSLQNLEPVLGTPVGDLPGLNIKSIRNSSTGG